MFRLGRFLAGIFVGGENGVVNKYFVTANGALIYFLTEWEEMRKRGALLEVTVFFWTSKLILIVLVSQNLARTLFSSPSSFRHSWLSHRPWN